VKKRARHILILRFSAIGDIAIGAPLVRAYAEANPDVRFTMVSQSRLETLFSGIENLNFFPVDFKGKYKGFRGLARLYRDLSRIRPTDIADLHNVIRTWVLRGYFFFNFLRIAFLHKGRAEKSELTRKKNKQLRQLPSMLSRYENVFVKLGLEDVNFADRDYFTTTRATEEHIRIGIAPFAKHKGKAWPYEYMEEVVSVLSGDKRFRIFLFGGGRNEETLLHAMEQKYSGVESAAGKYTLEEELEILKSLDLMISMDSANMHLASFVGTPVLSIWGATHPYAGFYGWNQKPENAVQLDLECRPCSVFGNKECYRGDYACLMNIKPQMVLDKVLSLTSRD
jgi:ADP-heptose:LPS heptosyltransferase